jgi:hypothetical protein
VFRKAWQPVSPPRAVSEPPASGIDFPFRFVSGHHTKVVGGPRAVGVALQGHKKSILFACRSQVPKTFTAIVIKGFVVREFVGKKVSIEPAAP